MKKIMKIAFVAAVAAVAGYNVYQSQSVMNGMSEFALANVEALASDENGKLDFWCCGNTGDCAIGDDLVIHGKLSDKPCP